MDEWTFYLFGSRRDEDTGEWIIWTRGCFEAVMEDMMAFRMGQFGDRYTQARIDSPERASR